MFQSIMSAWQIMCKSTDDRTAVVHFCQQIGSNSARNKEYICSMSITKKEKVNYCNKHCSQLLPAFPQYRGADCCGSTVIAVDHETHQPSYLSGFVEGLVSVTWFELIWPIQCFVDQGLLWAIPLASTVNWAWIHVGYQPFEPRILGSVRKITSLCQITIR